MNRLRSSVAPPSHHFLSFVLLNGRVYPPTTASPVGRSKVSDGRSSSSALCRPNPVVLVPKSLLWLFCCRHQQGGDKERGHMMNLNWPLSRRLWGQNLFPPIVLRQWAVWVWVSPHMEPPPPTHTRHPLSLPSGPLPVLLSFGLFLCRLLLITTRPPVTSRAPSVPGVVCVVSVLISRCGRL